MLLFIYSSCNSFRDIVDYLDLLISISDRPEKTLSFGENDFFGLWDLILTSSKNNQALSVELLQGFRLFSTHRHNALLQRS